MSGRAQVFVCVANEFVVIREDPKHADPVIREETFDPESSTLDGIVLASCQAALKFAKEYESCPIFIDEKQFLAVRDHLSGEDVAMFRPCGPPEYPKRLRKLYIQSPTRTILTEMIKKLYKSKRKRHYLRGQSVQ
jgi:hypothetical protein